MFNGADYVTVKNMGIVNTATSTMAVLLYTGSDNNTVTNCAISVITSSTSSVVNAIGSSNSITTRATNAFTNHNTVSNNLITGGYYGTYFYGGSAAIQVGNEVLNNKYVDTYLYGVYVYYADSTVISGNDIDMSSRGNAGADGIYGLYNNNFIISENNVVVPDYGIYISNSSTATPAMTRRNQLVNNMVVSTGDWGIYMYSVDSLDVFHNSVNVSGNTTPAFQIGQSTAYPTSGLSLIHI